MNFQKISQLIVLIIGIGVIFTVFTSIFTNEEISGKTNSDIVLNINAIKVMGNIESVDISNRIKNAKPDLIDLHKEKCSDSFDNALVNAIIIKKINDKFEYDCIFGNGYETSVFKNINFTSNLFSGYINECDDQLVNEIYQTYVTREYENECTPFRLTENTVINDFEEMTVFLYSCKQTDTLEAIEYFKNNLCYKESFVVNNPSQAFFVTGLIVDNKIYY